MKHKQKIYVPIDLTANPTLTTPYFDHHWYGRFLSSPQLFIVGNLDYIANEQYFFTPVFIGSDYHKVLHFKHWHSYNYDALRKLLIQSQIESYSIAKADAFKKIVRPNVLYGV